MEDSRRIEHFTMKESILRTKSFSFALEIVRLSRSLQLNKREYVLSKQLLRSGTAIGALLSEAEFGQSRADYIHKFSISLKEANESKYWLRLLFASSYITEEKFNVLSDNCKEIISMLVSSINTLKR